MYLVMLQLPKSLFKQMVKFSKNLRDTCLLKINIIIVRFYCSEKKLVNKNSFWKNLQPLQSLHWIILSTDWMFFWSILGKYSKCLQSHIRTWVYISLRENNKVSVANLQSTKKLRVQIYLFKNLGQIAAFMLFAGHFAQYWSTTSLL